MTRLEIVSARQRDEMRRRIDGETEYVEVHYDQDDRPVVFEARLDDHTTGALGPAVTVTVDDAMHLRFDSAEACRTWLEEIQDAVNAEEQRYLTRKVR